MAATKPINMVSAMLDFGTSTATDFRGDFFLFGDGPEAACAVPFVCLKGHCLPLVHRPALKYLHMAGCHQSHAEPLLQVPAMKALHGRF